MKIQFTIFTFLLISVYSFAQNQHKHVKLTEEKKGKRITLYANNTDSLSYDIFLKVDTKDFRRSSTRPILRNIAPNSKIKLLTLIQLNGTEGKYNTTFIVNEVAYAIEVEKDHEGLDFKIDEALKDKEVTLYTKNDCLICPDTKRILNNNKIAFTEYNIDKDSTNYLKIIKDFKNNTNKNFDNKIPVLKVNTAIYNKIESVEDFITALREAFN